MRGRAAAAAVLLLLPGSALAQATSPDAATLLANERGIVDIVRRVEPAVVNIRRFVKDEKWWVDAKARSVKVAPGWVQVPERDLLYEHQRPLADGGSGVVVSPDGYILTLNRVLLLPNGDEADLIDVELGKDHYRATIMAREPTIDLGILKIDAPDPLPFAPLGNNQGLEPGRFLLAFGRPGGPESVLLPGVVAQNPARECYQDELSATYLQTSMTFAGGVLGGPVVDASGRVVGMASQRGDAGAKARPGEPGFALPINLAMAIYESLLARQSRESPWIGVSVLRMTRETRRAAGAPDSIGIKVDNVFQPSPAATLDLRVGDVITRMQGEDVHTVYDFQRILYAAGVGQEITLDVVRKGTRLERRVRIEKRPPEAVTR
jgi:serine protease Do